MIEENDELEMYRQQIENEFFESVRQGENLSMYLYVPYLFITDRVRDRLDVFLIEEAFENLFVKRKPWIIYEDDRVVTTLADDEEYKRSFFQKMLEHYAAKEDFTKCAMIKNEYNEYL
jgi:hypothetical protein